MDHIREVTKMMERVADAVLADLLNRRGIRQAFDDIDDEIMAEIKGAIGRVAIEAMRQPTDQMLDAPKEWIEHEGDVRRAQPEDIWYAMIDAALTPSPTEDRKGA